MEFKNQIKQNELIHCKFYWYGILTFWSEFWRIGWPVVALCNDVPQGQPPSGEWREVDRSGASADPNRSGNPRCAARRIAGSHRHVVLCAVCSGQVLPRLGAGLSAVFRGIAQEDEWVRRLKV
jgi:hypothetical protein